jgi:uncharacterized phage-associated protein
VIKYVFNARKSAQAAAVLLKLNGGDMENYCFIKMLYLADREAYAKWGQPITGDEAVSMRFGPVLSTIYDLTKGERPSLRADWSPYISDVEEETHRVFLKEDPGADELSPAEVRMIEGVHARFGDYTWKAMKDFAHSLPEYDGSVGNSSKPIPVESILRAVGRTREQIQETERSVKESQMLDLIFSAS